MKGEKEIDINQINRERSMATVDEEEHAVLDRLTFDYQQKLQGKPQSHEMVRSFRLCNWCESVKLTPQVCNGPPASMNGLLFFGVVGSGCAWKSRGGRFDLNIGQIPLMELARQRPLHTSYTFTSIPHTHTSCLFMSLTKYTNSLTTQCHLHSWCDLAVGFAVPHRPHHVIFMCSVCVSL